MLAIVRFDPPSDVDDFLQNAEAALIAFAACVGFERGWFARGTDDPEIWVLTTVWESVGSYRRALSTYDVKLHVTPFMFGARDEVTGFEPRLVARPGEVTRRAGDLADDAGSADIGDFGPRRSGGDR